MALEIYHELNEPPVVNGSYLAEAVSDEGVWIPVHTPAHRSPLGHLHFHMIHEFLHPEVIRFLLYRTTGLCGGVNVVEERHQLKNRTIDGRLKTELKEFRCYWEPGSFEPIESEVHNEALARVEREIGDKKLDLQTKVCPHQGICMKRVPEIDGAYQCPAHDAIFRASDGSLVRQTGLA